MRYKRFCDNCGFCTLLSESESYKQCPVCKNRLAPIGFIDGHKLANMSPAQRVFWIENKLGHPIQKDLSDKRDAYYQDRIMKYKQKSEEEQKLSSEESFRQFQYNQAHAPECPYCQSTNLSKIGTVGRALSVGTFGLASGKIGKQFHCNNCGADF